MKKLIRNRHGKNLSVQIDGQADAPVILFSNSLGTDLGMWDAQLQSLQQHYQIVRYDTRGHGRSDVINHSTLQGLGEDVIDIMNKLDIDQAHFCGISMGGITGLWLGLHASERFKSITVANTAAKIGQPEAWLSRAEQVRESGLADLVRTTHSRWFSENFDHHNHALAQQTIQSLAKTRVEGYAQSCMALAEADLRADLAQIKLPMLVICGSEDPVTTIADGEFINLHVAQSELIQLPASHLSNIECADLFSQTLKHFIQQQA
ncbi:3-oxoadipate enol-lactonase [Acinetobacter calcoaceticus]|uniref:3-oxoadipate enol-lactonase n=1 Tax=Acinetobacter calcoaceticus TaxID=471 RepID=A0A4R1Y2S6_ACICA|nr:3-oxoadipate enol-lactonase [Acinetobacter calcoaceticus]